MPISHPLSGGMAGSERDMAENLSAPALSGPTRRRFSIWRFGARLMAGVTLLLAVLLLIAALAPATSTLMLWRGLTGQPVDRRWVPLDEIAPAMRQAVIASEDQRFCSHHGVDFGALRQVLSDEDGPTRGGSTITMQTVKNLWLWHGRSYVRKALELPLAFVADLFLSKRRILELYLNIAEFGEGVFGVEAAARRYYGIPAARLDRRQAAALAAALPNPRLRNPGAPSRRAATNSLRIQQRANGLGPLGDCAA